MSHHLFLFQMNPPLNKVKGFSCDEEYLDAARMVSAGHHLARRLERLNA